MLLLADFPLHGWEFRKDAPRLRISGNIKTHGANATERDVSVTRFKIEIGLLDVY